MFNTSSIPSSLAVCLTLSSISLAGTFCIESASAIITNPKLILADEPTGALDSRSSRMLLESFNFLNTELSATILMVTHDAFTASYAGRVIFIKDGKIFNEIRRGESTRKEFFDKIIDVVTLLGGDLNNAL